MVHGTNAYVYYGIEIPKEDCEELVNIIDPLCEKDLKVIYSIEKKYSRPYKRSYIRKYSYFILIGVKTEFDFGKNDGTINKMLFMEDTLSEILSNYEYYKKNFPYTFYNFGSYGPMIFSIEDINQVTKEPLTVPEFTEEFKYVLKEYKKLKNIDIIDLNWYFQTEQY